MPAGQLIADADFTNGGHLNLNGFNDPGGQSVAFFALKDLHVNDPATLAMRQGPRGIAHFAGFFAKNRPQQSLLASQFRLAFGRNFTH